MLFVLMRLVIVMLLTISSLARRAMIAPNHAENEADKDKLHIAHTARVREREASKCYMRASRFMCHGRHPINSDWIDSP
jgi:hypothetical protein